MNLETIKVHRDGAVVTLTLDRAQAANSLDLQMADDLLSAANACASDAGVRAVILTAEGRMFCAGGDVAAFAATANPGELLRGITTRMHAAIQRFQRMDAPLVVAVNGVAAGAGMSIALGGDFVLAAESAKFTLAYTALGLSPDGGSTFFLPRLLGIRRAKELMIRNDLLSASAALELGLVSRVLPDDALMTDARELAADLARGPTRAYGAVKRLVAGSLANTLDTQLELEARSIAELANHTADARDGIAAFVGKKKPTFNGR